MARKPPNLPVEAVRQFAEDTRDDMHLSGHAAGSFSSSAQRHEMNLLDNLFADLGDLTADIG